ncbi:MAG: hypothetical protein H6P99_620 [Holophagaceae bacterium]|nr:hypothetical protein [Holophagaceae bacterium]
MVREAWFHGFRRSLAVSTSWLLGTGILALALRSLPGGPLLEAAWRILVFPHPSFAVPGAFPDRPAALVSFPLALGLAVVQWTLVLLGLAWFARAKGLRVQVALSLLVILSTGLIVAGTALAAGLQLRLD